MEINWTKTWMPMTLALTMMLAGSAYAADTETTPDQQQTDQAQTEQSQSDAKTKDQAGAKDKAGKKKHRGGKGHGLKGIGPGGVKSEALQTLLGVTGEELKEALKAGRTLAELAQEKGVGAQAVIDLLVKEHTAKLDEQLTAGKLTQEQYDSRKAKLAEHAQQLVNNQLPAKPDKSLKPGKNGEGRHPGGGKGKGHKPGASADGSTPGAAGSAASAGQAGSGNAAARSTSIPSAAATGSA